MKSISASAKWVFPLAVSCAAWFGIHAADSMPASADPLADQVLEQHVMASGGTNAFQRLTSRRVTGTLERHGNKVPLIRIQKAPNQLLVETRFPRPGTLKQGFDGRIGWLNHPLQGGRQLEGRELAALADEAWLHPTLRLKSQYPLRRLMPSRVVEGRNLTVLSLSRSKTDEPELWFFDPETSLLARVERHVDGGKHGKIPVVVAFDDYRKVDGAMMPFTVRTKLPTSETVLHTVSVEHNLTLDDTIFQPPF